jgi:siroheme synthase
VEQLTRSGRPPSTPAIAIENAGRPDARSLCAALEDLPAVIEAARPSGPVVLLIGDVVAHAGAAAFQKPFARTQAT